MRVPILPVLALVCSAPGCVADIPDCAGGTAEPWECPGFERPQGEFSQLESELEPLLVHVGEGVDPELAVALRAEAERAIELNRRWGMPELPPDWFGPDERFDLYLVEQGRAAGWTAQDSDIHLPDGCPSWSAILVGDDPTSDPATVQHELRHASQLAAICSQAPLLEGDATFAVDAADPELAYALAEFVPAFQADPGAPIFEPTEHEPYIYGSALWYRYLAERFGEGSPAFFSELLVALDPQGSLLADLDAALLARGSSLPEAFAEFALWRLLTPHRSDDSPWTDFGEDWPLDTRVATESDVGQDGIYEGSPGSGGSAFFEVPADRAVRATLTVEDPEDWTLQALTLDPVGAWEQHRGDGVLDLPVAPSPGWAWVFVTFTAVGWSADGVQGSFELEFELDA